jgi:hypothetical protein
MIDEMISVGAPMITTEGSTTRMEAVTAVRLVAKQMEGHFHELAKSTVCATQRPDRMEHVIQKIQDVALKGGIDIDFLTRDLNERTAAMKF